MGEVDNKEEVGNMGEANGKEELGKKEVTDIGVTVV